MHILLTNDDGIFAPGLASVYKHLTKLGKVTVVAPSQVQSGASHSISLNPLRCEKVDIVGKFTGFSVDGTPADCVNLALNHLENTVGKIDMVVSGVNCGANVGIHVHYSGTVAAAVEAAFSSIPAAALSAAWEEGIDMEAVAEQAFVVLEKLLPLSKNDIININVPRLSTGSPRGIKVVPHSTSGFEEAYAKETDENGDTIYTFNHGKHLDGPKDFVDTSAINNGYITVTALHFDITDYERNSSIAKKLTGENDG